MAWSYNTSDETLTRGPDITALVLAFTSAALLVITCRIYVRAVLIKALGYGMYRDCVILFGNKFQYG